MTCLNKRRFKNPLKTEKRGSYDKYTIQGSCGCCAGCNKTKQNDWLVRAYFEYMSKDTTAYFVSLDFDEQHIPKFNGLNCFDSELMSKWFETLRAVLPKFRYLYSSHLGEAMKRPHYHVMFFFDKNAIDCISFFNIVQKYWKYGSHEDISQLRSVRDNPLAGVEYCTKYTTRDRKAAAYFRIHKFPARYRPRTYASVGFGSQCLDPTEFKSETLIKNGVIFDEYPTITRKFILENSLVYLDIKKDGVLVPFAIPRYYELKLMYDFTWNSQEKKQECSKNSYGKELQVVRHNCHYIHLYNEFLNSKNLKIHEDKYTSFVFKNVFPESPYNGLEWHDIVDDITLDKDKFFDFCKVYSWLEFDTRGYGFTRYRPLKHRYSNPFGFGSNIVGHYYKAASCSSDEYGSFDNYFDSDIDLYIQAISYFQIWKDIHNRRKAEYEDWKAQEASKVKIRQRCKRDLGYYWHLRRHGFKFYTLNPSNYVSQYQIGADCV